MGMSVPKTSNYEWTCDIVRKVEYKESWRTFLGKCWIQASNGSKYYASIGVCHWFGKYEAMKFTCMNELLEDKKQCKFGVIMTLCQHVIFTSFYHLFY